MNKRGIFTIFLLVILVLPLKGQSIEDLSFLIGNWALRDVVYEGSERGYVEEGKRQCYYRLDRTYIECKTTAELKGKTRTYVSQINYDPGKKYFRMSTQFSDYGFRGGYNALVDLESKTLTLIPKFDMEDEGFYRSIIDFSNPDQLVWSGYMSSFKGPPRWDKFYTETATRQNR